jgi:hypothetical protein
MGVAAQVVEHCGMCSAVFAAQVTRAPKQQIAVHDHEVSLSQDFPADRLSTDRLKAPLVGLRTNTSEVNLLSLDPASSNSRH